MKYYKWRLVLTIIFQCLSSTFMMTMLASFAPHNQIPKYSVQLVFVPYFLCYAHASDIPCTNSTSLVPRFVLKMRLRNASRPQISILYHTSDLRCDILLPAEGKPKAVMTLYPSVKPHFSIPALGLVLIKRAWGCYTQGNGISDGQTLVFWTGQWVVYIPTSHGMR